MTKESISTAVQVALRIRPLTDRDRLQPRFANLANDDVLKIVENSSIQVIPHNKQFRFDHVFDTQSRQEDVFTTLGDPLVRKFIQGYNVTILAYGQTSSGKTYTMGTATTSISNPTEEGIVPRSMALLFDLLQQQQQQDQVDTLNNHQNRPLSPTSSVSSFTSATHKSKLRPVSSRLSTSNTRHSHLSIHNQQQQQQQQQQKSRFSVKVSFIEIYNEELNDLLNLAPVEERPPVTIREDTRGNIYWTGVKEVSVHSTEDVLNFLEQGTRNRATGSTDMNEKSSRSHAIFSVSLRQEKPITETNKTLRRPNSSMSVKSNGSSRRNLTDDGNSSEWIITTSKFHFVDLAGSERLKRTAAQGDRRKEGININAGLSALGNVISALGDPSNKKKVHVPYRDSKLTRLLQDSLGGNATTLMIACASPAEHNLSETLNTLQYASRARNIRNKSEKNEMEEWMSSDNTEFLRGLISKLKSEVKHLKSTATANTSKSTSNNEDKSVSGGCSSREGETEEEVDLDDDFEQFHDQRMIIADLKRQVEELDGEATVTRERNRIVENELQRLHTLLENTATTTTAKSNKVEMDDFAHLVEPVIEEYEKSISKLESQLAMTRAALNHTNTSFEEQTAKINIMEATTQAQERTINDLRNRLSKLIDREHGNETYIQELESKLIKSANDATRDQEMLNELKSRILKLKETDENTEQYINNLEERLAASDAERARLQNLVEELETKLAIQEHEHIELLKSIANNTNNNNKDNNNDTINDQQQTIAAMAADKLILKELDHVNTKLLLAEKERDSFKIKMEQLQKKSTTPTPSVSKEKVLTSSSSTKSHRSTSSSHRQRKVSTTLSEPVSPTPTVSTLSLLHAERKRAQEETERANKLQIAMNRLKQDHEETVKELDEVLQRYQEALEQVDQLEEGQSSTDDGTLNSPSLSSTTTGFINSMHNEQFCIKEKQSLNDHISELEKKIQDHLLDYSDQKSTSVKEIKLLEDAMNQLKIEQEEYKKKAALDLARIQQLQHELSIAQSQNIAPTMSSKSNPNDDSGDDDCIHSNNSTENKTTFLASSQNEHDGDNDGDNDNTLKQAQELLLHDIKRLNKCLDEKKKHIASLESQKVMLEQERTKLVSQRDELEQLLNESQGHSEGLHKRLSDTLASLTVLKVKHDALLKKQKKDSDINNNATCEPEQIERTMAAPVMEVMNDEKRDGADACELSLLQKELDETVAKKESLTKLLQSTMEEKQILSADIAQLEEELNGLHQLHDMEKSQAEKTRKKLETLERLKVDLQDTIDGYHSDNTRLNQSLTEALDTNHVTSKKLEALQLAFDEVTSSYSMDQAASKRITYLECTLDDLMAEKSKLIETHEQELETLKAELLTKYDANSNRLLLPSTSSSPFSTAAAAVANEEEELKNYHERSTDDNLSSQLQIRQKERSEPPPLHVKIGQCPNGGEQPISLELSFESLKKEIVLLNKTNQAKDTQIEIQRSQIESLTQTIESLEKVKTEDSTPPTTVLENNQKNVEATNVTIEVEEEEENQCLKDHIEILEANLKQITNDNLEQVKLSESLQKEVDRITKALGATSEQYKATKSTVLRYEEQLAQINQLLTENINSSYDSLPMTPNQDTNNNVTLRKAKKLNLQIYDGISNEKDRMSPPITETSPLDNVSDDVGSSTTSTTTATETKMLTIIKKIKKELYDSQIKAKEAADAKQALEQELLDQQNEYQYLISAEREKLDKSKKAQHILEKRLDEMLRKKKFVCF